jgi:hypothetical protein
MERDLDEEGKVEEEVRRGKVNGRKRSEGRG